LQIFRIIRNPVVFDEEAGREQPYTNNEDGKPCQHFSKGAQEEVPQPNQYKRAPYADQIHVGAVEHVVNPLVEVIESKSADHIVCDFLLSNRQLIDVGHAVLVQEVDCCVGAWAFHCNGGAEAIDRLHVGCVVARHKVLRRGWTFFDAHCEWQPGNYAANVLVPKHGVVFIASAHSAEVTIGVHGGQDEIRIAVRNSIGPDVAHATTGGEEDE